MKIQQLHLIVLLLFAPSLLEAQDAGRDARRLAELEEIGYPSDFEGICSGRAGALWCGGYFSGIVSALGISDNNACFMLVDVARFAYESVWLTTSEWLYQQPDDLRITYFEAVYRALSERDSCSP